MAKITGSEILDMLMEGNRRFVEGKSAHPHQNAQRRTELISGQDPDAIIVTCSDSRISPEIIFDQGLGDFFEIMLAGNVVDDMAIGSIEYAAQHLGTNLLIVLGHTSCGAVTATVDGVQPEGHLCTIINAIKLAVEKAKEIGGDLLEETIKQNALMVADKLRSSEPVLKKLTDSDKLLVKACIYDISTGIVSTL